MPRLWKEILMTVVIISATIGAVLSVISGIRLVSYTPIARLSIESLIACWSAICVGLSLVITRNRFTLSSLFLTASFSSIILRRALILIYLLQIRELPITPLSTLHTVFNLHEVLLTSLFLFLANSLRTPDRRLECSPRSILLAVSITVLAPAIYYTVVWYVFQYVQMPVDVFNQSVMIALVCVLALFGIAMAQVFRRNINRIFERTYFVAAVVLLSLASTLFLYSIIVPSDVWVYAENMEVAAIFLFGLSMSQVYLLRLGLSTVKSYLLYISLAISSYLPALFSTILAVTAEDIFSPLPNYLTYYVIDFGVGFLCAVIAWLLHSYSRIRPTRGQTELILVFGLWSSVFIVPIITSILERSISRWPDRVLTPYIAMSILTLLILFKTAVNSVLSTHATESVSSTSMSNENNSQSLFFKISALILTVLLATHLHYVLIDIAGIRIGGHPDIVLLMVSNLLMLTIMSYLIFTSCETLAPRLSPETYVMLFLALCILPNILRCIHQLWTIGWWIAEFTLFVSLFVGPVLIVLLYKDAMKELQQSQRRAQLYADLLMHDITNYNQMILTSLELLSLKSGDDNPETMNAIFSAAHRALALSTQLIRNVRLLNSTEDLSIPQPRHPVDLVSALVTALDIATHQYDTHRVVLRLNTVTISAPVMANDNLSTVFLNIIISIVQRLEMSGIESTTLSFDITKSRQFGDRWWAARAYVQDLQLQVIEPESYFDLRLESKGTRDLSLFVAKALVESMGGLFYVTNFSRGSIVSIELPVSDIPPA